MYLCDYTTGQHNRSRTMARDKRTLTAFRLSEEELAMLDAIAAKDSQNRSEAFRKMIRDKYKRVAK